MNFSEFKRMLGAEPRSEDPAFLRARHSAPEFEQAAAEADRFESLLDRAVSIPVPDRLLSDLQVIADEPPDLGERKKWWPMAIAASVLIAVGAAGLNWKLNPAWDSVEDYLADHYHHDGPALLAKADGAHADNVQAVLSKLEVQAEPGLDEIVNVIKYCPTPDGKGVHMVVHTETGPVTIIYMPETAVTDREMLAFDGVEAMLVDLPKGSAAIIGNRSQSIAQLYAIVHESIVPLPGSS